jgi:hypothetical protein
MKFPFLAVLTTTLTLLTTTQGGGLPNTIVGLIRSEDLQQYDAHLPYSVSLDDEKFNLHSLNWREGKVFALFGLWENNFPFPVSPASLCKLSKTTCDRATW